MDKSMTVEEIDNKIAELEQELGSVRGRPTEVYTRIVGYYRAVKNWNRGKREEYTYRKTYGLPEGAPHRNESPAFVQAKPAQDDSPEVSPVESIAGYQYFFRTTCPNCPPVKSYLAELGFSGNEINVDMDEGFELAGNLAVCATPTVIFRDSRGDELFRASNLQDLIRTFEPRRAVS